MAEITVPAKCEELDRVIDFVNVHLDEVGCDSYNKATLDIAVEEIFVNIASYAYECSAEGDAVVRIILCGNPPEIVLQFIDKGVQYNPLEQEDPDVTLELDERAVGGLGIFLVKESMDEMTYEFKDGKNILTIVKRLEVPEEELQEE